MQQFPELEEIGGLATGPFGPFDVGTNPNLPEDLDELRKARLHRGRELAEQVEGLTRQLPGSMERLATIPTRAGFKEQVAARGLQGFATGNPLVGAVGSVLGSAEALIPALGRVEEAEEQISILNKQLIAANNELYETVWQANIINNLPLWLRTGVVEGPQDVLTITGADISRLNNPFDFLTDTINRIEVFQDSQAQRRDDTLTELEARGGELSKFLAVNPNTQSEVSLVNQLLEAGRFDIPEGLSPSDLREILTSLVEATKLSDSLLVN